MSAEKKTAGRYPARLAAALGVGVLAITGLTVLLYYKLYPSPVGELQPIPFSHRLHAGQKTISCVFCHPGTIRTSRAGIPPLEKCMLCHERIIVAFPKIVNLHRHYEAGRPVEWNRVNSLPDFVYFSHSVHTHRGFDCGRCHGDVKAMDRVVQVQDFKMGFCVRCHRDEGASHDCLVCHR